MVNGIVRVMVIGYLSLATAACAVDAQDDTLDGESSFVDQSEALQIGGLDDRSRTGGYSESGPWGVYVVPAGSSTDIHDPRVERMLDDRKIDTHVFRTFRATYNIVRADNTTIAQVLNHDPSSSDPHKPVIFIVVRSNGSNWDIYNQSTKLHSIPKNSGGSTPTFRLKVDSYSGSADGSVAMFSDVYINGVKKGTFKHARVGADSTMRYGAYHHGGGTAEIRIRDVVFR